MIIETLVISIIVGKLRGGKLTNLADISLLKWGFIPAAFFLSYISIYLITQGNVILMENFTIIQLTSNSLLLLTLYFNRKTKPFKLVSIGILSNIIPMTFNGGRMPVSRWALEKAGLLEELSLIADNRIVTHTIIDSDTEFVFLSDIIPLIYKAISIGDIFIALGIFLIIQNYMTSTEPLQRN
ncbi:DUF5317 domain-containing protein [Gudongella sp. DL1XJH-153]|uniref:DUF5317 domain-containing protein n=1 Tax=Gudongella sp. DL1XJH-153 TaxID=3409804 RepID=UPI003BB67490